MAEPTPPPTDDLEAQLDALMAQATDTPSEADTAAAVAEPDPPAADEHRGTEPAEGETGNDLAAQLDALMADAATNGADATADVEAALDEVEGAFEAVRDVVDQLEPEDASTAEAEAADASDSEADNEPEDGERLANQLQALIDEARSAEEAAPPAEAEAEAEVEAGASAGADTDDTEDAGDQPPLIEQLDSLLADHAEDALAGDFESVESLLGTEGDPPPAAQPEPATEAANQAAEAAAEATEEEDAEDDELDGGFASPDEVFGTDPTTDAEPDAEPDPEAEAEPVGEASAPAEPTAAEDPGDEGDDAFDGLDEIDGLFEAPEATIPRPSPPPPAAESPQQEPGFESDAEDETEGGDPADAGFASLDAMLTAAPPDPADADGAPRPAAADPANTPAGKKERKPGRSDGWSITLNLASLRRALDAVKPAAAYALGWALWACLLVNAPLGKLPDEWRQTVGWVAWAVAGPGVLLVLYGLLT